MKKFLTLFAFYCLLLLNLKSEEQNSFMNDIIRNESVGVGFSSVNGSHLGFNFELDLYNFFAGGSISLDESKIDHELNLSTNEIDYMYEDSRDIYFGYNYLINDEWSVLGGIGYSLKGGDIIDLEISSGQTFNRGNWEDSEVIYLVGVRYYFNSFYAYGNINSMLGGNLGVGISFGKLFEKK